MIENIVENFKKEFEETIDELGYMPDIDRLKWKSFGHKICDTINVLYYTNKNDVKAVQKNIEAIQAACKLIHKGDDILVNSSNFDKHADNYVDKKIKYVGWLIVALFGIVTAFGTYIWQTSMVNITDARIEIKETKKEIREFKDVFIEYLKVNK